MLKQSLIVLLVVFISVTSQAQNHGTKLNVLVLYESLCPDSTKFMRQQLGPSYELLKDYIDITLVPFGKSQSQNNGAQFYCQHGIDECEGNRMQSCVLHQTDDQEKHVHFAVCQMTTRERRSVKNCAEASGLSSAIDECMLTDLGTLLQLEAEQITHSYRPTFIPTIIYDRVFNQQLQDNSIYDFRGTVCKELLRRGIITVESAACQ